MRVMKIVGTACELFSRPVLLKSYDPDGNGGHGDIEVTLDEAEAKRYETAREALEDLRRVSTVMPLRPDGCPNRPLSAYTIEVEEEGKWSG